MKNLLESVAIFLVVLLSLGIIFLIVQYNLIEDDNIVDKVAYEIPQKKKMSTKVKARNYLHTLEGYEDIDVEADATKDTMINTIIVKSESSDNNLISAVNDKSKLSYMQNLENYADVAAEEKLDTMKPIEDGVGVPETLDDAAVVDKDTMDIGDDISSAVDDKSKSSYMKNLDNYADKAKKENLDTINPKDDGEGDPEKLDQEEIIDEVGMAIDDLMDDI